MICNDKSNVLSRGPFSLHFGFLTSSNTRSTKNYRYIHNSQTTITMLELTKKILRGVSFDAQLFQKELLKARKWITDAEEIKKFHEWCIVEFGTIYPLIIKKAFAPTTS